MGNCEEKKWVTVKRVLSCVAKIYPQICVNLWIKIYFSLFSRVALFSDVKCTRLKPYSEVRTKDFGRSSQGTTSPSFSAAIKNSRVRLEVEVLSKSKIPMIDLSRTAISLPMDKYILFSTLPDRNNPDPIESDLFQYTSRFCHNPLCCEWYDHERISARFLHKIPIHAFSLKYSSSDIPQHWIWQTDYVGAIRESPLHLIEKTAFYGYLCRLL